MRARGNGIEVIARGVWKEKGRILLCRNRGATYSYLPGGHVEFGEGAEAALRRELREETGGRFQILRFLGADEEVFLQEGRRHAELNLVFQIQGPKPWVFPRRPPAREPHLEFFWVPIDELKYAGFLPQGLGFLLPRWIRRRSLGGWFGLEHRPAPYRR